MEEQKKKFPNVLLLGNGILRAYSKEVKSWEKLISDYEYGLDIPEKELKKVPFPLRVVLKTNDNVKKFVKDNLNNFYVKHKSKKLVEILEKYISLPFDAILTTNYGYEIEDVALKKDCSTKKELDSIKCCVRKESKESKYFLYTHYNCCCADRIRKVWHIHGEMNKPDSVIIGNYYYGQLLHKFEEHLSIRRNDYEKNFAGKEERCPHSWIDDFIMGDVFIVGFGFDYSELDLWWLLNRKKRENASHGKVYYFDLNSHKNREIIQLLRQYDCEINYGIEYDGRNRFKKFYSMVSDSIKKIITEKATSV